MIATIAATAFWVFGWCYALYSIEKNYEFEKLSWWGAPVLLILWPLWLYEPTRRWMTGDNDNSCRVL